MKYSLHSSSIKNLETLLYSKAPNSRVLVSLVKDFIKVTPIDFAIIRNGGYRTAEEQNKIYQKGRTIGAKGNTVTDCDGYRYKSKHQSGLAVDLVPWIKGAYSWDRDHALVLAGAFIAFCRVKGFNVVSGADWNMDGYIKYDSWDPVHFEIRGEL